jgi:hypothetical protein
VIGLPLPVRPVPPPARGIVVGYGGAAPAAMAASVDGVAGAYLSFPLCGCAMCAGRGRVGRRCRASR